MATLTNTQISVTYVGLLKTTGNTVLSSTAQQITDGTGNNTIMYLSTAGVGIGGAPASGKELDVTGNVKVTGDLIIDNLKIDGNTISAESGVVTLANGAIATTQSASDNSTKIATTAYVDAQAGLADTLSEVLALGNTTGATKIEVDNTSGGIDFIDNAKARFGTADDLEIFHDSTDSYITNTNGNLIIQNDHNDKDIFFKCDSGAGGLVTYLFLDGSDVNTRFLKDFKVSDNIKGLFGSDGDLEIFHDSNNSFISEVGTGDLTISTNGTSIFLKTNSTESSADFVTNGAVNLYHDNSKKFETTSTGVTVTGGIIAKEKGTQLGSTGYFINSQFLDVSDNVGVFIGHNDTSNGAGAIAGINSLAFLTFGTAWTQALLLDSSQNATFAGNITISKDVPVLFLTDTNSDSDYSIKNNDGVFDIRDETNGTNRLRIGSDGSVNIYNDTTFGGNVKVTGNQEKVLELDSSADTGSIHFEEGGTIRGILGFSNGSSISSSASDNDMVLRSESALLLTTNTGNVALTLDTSQNATFAGVITMPGGHTIQNDSNGNFDMRTTTAGKEIFILANGSLRLDSGGAQALVLDSSQNATFAGNVNITGTTITLSTAGGTGVIQSNQASGTNTAGGALQLYGGRSTGNAAGGDIQFFVTPAGSSGSSVNSPTQAMHIEASNSNVGIGTTSPSANLSVGSTSTSSGDVHLRTTKTTFSITPSNSDAGGILLDLGFVNGGQGPMKFAIGGTERARITSGGDLLVGRTSAIASGHNITGSQSNGGQSVLEIFNSNSSDVSPALNLIKHSSTTSSTARFQQFYSNGGQQPMGGIVGNGTENVQFFTLSDKREKDNITEISGSLDKIMQLQVSEFDWKKTGEHIKAGFVAQNVEKVFPEYIVENVNDNDKESRKGITGGMSAGYIAHLTRAIQEQQDMIQELKKEIEILKSK